MRIGLSSPQDFLALLVRRKWWVAVPFLALSSAAALMTYILPGAFVSEALILVRPRDVPVQFVMDLIAGSSQQRLSTIEQTLRSRTNLLQILREFEDRLPEYRHLNMDARVDRLNSKIEIKFQLEEGGVTKPALTGLRISYQNQNPELAQQIATKLTTLFIDQDNHVRETQVFGTTAFLSSELQKISDQLSVSEKQLTDVKSANQFALPGQLETSLRTLDRLTLERQSNAEALDRNAALRLNLERQISETPELLAQTIPAPVAANAADPRVEEYRKAKLEYDEAAATLTPKHPQVRALKARVERLEGHLPPNALATGPSQNAASNDAASPMTPNLLYQKLAAQLQEVKTESAIREKEKSYIESEIQKLTRRVESSPKSEQQVADAIRQNGTLQKQYDDLKSKLAEAQLAESLEGKQKGSQFVIVDPANYPLLPSKPNKLFVLLAGVVGSLAIAIGLALAIDVARQRVWTQSEIETFWGAPILIDTPEILTDSDLAALRKRKFAYAASLLGGALAYSACLYLVYIKHGFVLQHLDPVLQRLLYK